MNTPGGIMSLGPRWRAAGLEVAALGAPLDVFLVRKLGVPAARSWPWG
jgi:predicted phosphoribosyltransferase